MKKIFSFTAILLIIVLIICNISYILFQNPLYFIKSRVIIEKSKTTNDKDKDGIVDSDDIVQGARQEVLNKTKYKSVYYVGGYPPEDEGVCTDVIWRSLKKAGFDLKTELDNDIKKNLMLYYGVVDKPDPNIDFRRVKNQLVYFRTNLISLSSEVILYDINNLKEWQGGDIVILDNSDHVAIISDKRRRDGVPYVIHNGSTVAKEQDLLMLWRNRIIGHFRYEATEHFDNENLQ